MTATSADLRLHGGRVFVESGDLIWADLLIRGEQVVGIVSPDAMAEAREVVNLDGAAVLPGAIDPHVHLGKDIRVPRDADDAESESASAAAGGVTSMIVYLMSAESYHKVMPPARKVMSSHSRTDFGFHYVLGTPEHLEELPSYVRDHGVSSFKFFMNFRGDEGSYLGMPGNDDGFMYELAGLVADHSAMINPHPENIELVWHLRDNARGERADSLSSWNAYRPPFVEAEAQQRVAYLASITGASMYAVHTSCLAALDAIRLQRTRYQNLFVETCPHYLTLSTQSTCGSYGKVNPPLRPPENVEALWEGLADGSIDTVGSDHNARHRQNKERDIWQATAGFPGVGTLLPLTIGEGMRRGIALSRLVDAVSTRAAKLFGLYPRKGTIRVGSDADLAVIDLDASTVFDASTQYSQAEYTPWQGYEVPLRVVHTLVRGKFVFRDGALTGAERGIYLPRQRSGASALAAAGAAEKGSHT